LHYLGGTAAAAPLPAGPTAHATGTRDRPPPPFRGPAERPEPAPLSPLGATASHGESRRATAQPAWRRRRAVPASVPGPRPTGGACSGGGCAAPARAGRAPAGRAFGPGPAAGALSRGAAARRRCFLAAPDSALECPAAPCAVGPAPIRAGYGPGPGPIAEPIGRAGPVATKGATRTLPPVPTAPPRPVSSSPTAAAGRRLWVGPPRPLHRVTPRDAWRCGAVPAPVHDPETVWIRRPGWHPSCGVRPAKEGEGSAGADGSSRLGRLMRRRGCMQVPPGSRRGPARRRLTPGNGTLSLC
jgi:hypothetical protein